MEPTTGLEPVNLFLTKEVLYLLSYVGPLEKSQGQQAKGRHKAWNPISFDTGASQRAPTGKSRRVEVPNQRV